MSKVMLVDPKTNKPTRIHIKTLPNGDKVRVASSPARPSPNKRPINNHG